MKRGEAVLLEVGSDVTVAAYEESEELTEEDECRQRRLGGLNIDDQGNDEEQGQWQQFQQQVYDPCCGWWQIHPTRQTCPIPRVDGQTVA